MCVYARIEQQIEKIEKVMKEERRSLFSKAGFQPERLTSRRDDPPDCASSFRERYQEHTCFLFIVFESTGKSRINVFRIL